MDQDQGPNGELTSDSGQLEWLLVLCSRRSWTALSLAVLGAVAWVVLVRRAAGLNTAPAWAVAGLAAVSGVVWVRTQQTIFRIRRALGRAVVLFHLG